MRNNVKDINKKTKRIIFSIRLSIEKSLIRLILKQIKSHRKIFLFTISDMRRSKKTQKFIVQILCTLFSIK